MSNCSDAGNIGLVYYIIYIVPGIAPVLFCRFFVMFVLDLVHITLHQPLPIHRHPVVVEPSPLSPTKLRGLGPEGHLHFQYHMMEYLHKVTRCGIRRDLAHPVCVLLL